MSRCRPALRFQIPQMRSFTGRWPQGAGQGEPASAGALLALLRQGGGRAAKGCSGLESFSAGWLVRPGMMPVLVRQGRFIARFEKPSPAL